MDTTNSTRFVSSYNRIDKLLRNIFSLKPSLTFTDVVRRTATSHSIVRKYEDELLDYARLRNAIVHKSQPSLAIAEPHDSVVEEIEKIERLIAEPPKAISKVAKPSCKLMSRTLVKDAIVIMAGHNYSYVPVIRETNEIVGVLTNKDLVEFVAKNFDDLPTALAKTTVETIIKQSSEYYEICDKQISLTDVMQLFYAKRKLAILLLTRDGTKFSEIEGIIAVSDIVEINNILDSYD